MYKKLLSEYFMHVIIIKYYSYQNKINILHETNFRCSMRFSEDILEIFFRTLNICNVII